MKKEVNPLGIVIELTAVHYFHLHRHNSREFGRVNPSYFQDKLQLSDSVYDWELFNPVIETFTDPGSSLAMWVLFNLISTVSFPVDVH